MVAEGPARAAAVELVEEAGQEPVVVAELGLAVVARAQAVMAVAAVEVVARAWVHLAVVEVRSPENGKAPRRCCAAR